MRLNSYVEESNLNSVVISIYRSILISVTSNIVVSFARCYCFVTHRYSSVVSAHDY